MAYKGKVDLKTAYPNAPLAKPRLSFGGQPAPNSPQSLEEKALAMAKAAPPNIKRGTIEASLARWLESQEQTPGDARVDLVKLWNLPPSFDAHKNPRPLVDSDIFSAAQEIGWATPAWAPVLWESQRFKEQHSQTPFYAQRVAKRGARVWLELSQSYRGTV